MKLLIAIAALFVLICCSEPRSITFNPDDRAATSGTVGSAKVTTQVPERSLDTTVVRDTVGARRDSLRRN